ncbi:phosphoribosylformylglycinamidine synthase [Mariniphaga anaerophila]|uniref:Phosphoribosylformylglycinamidine synthase n=1 Tax=Mariniphaga anaerophila TaxID=1484053 RepID=A0A1M5DA80_9BACT|nr:AIR synthase-related protein [Mariniphaga anaerophila]SHF63854.1 phosphoribosylformylglycinamidine synthase [Mariniphaga anaerophila]
MKEAMQQKEEFTLDSIPEPTDIENIIYSLMVNPNLSSINYFNDFSEAGISPESIGDGDNDEIGLFDIDSTGTSLAMSTHAFHHHLENDPQKATEILIARAARKMLCLGAQPTAVSAFLYHIDFADPNGQYIASGAKKGLENAAEKFNLKVSDKKIRFDHFSGHGPVPPTIIISMVGVVEDKEKLTTHAFKQKGGNIFLIGRSVEDIGSSEYLEFYHGISDSPLPAFNMEDELRIQAAMRELHKLGLLQSASPVGKGGLFFTLLRAAIPNGLGFDITTDAETRMDSFLFGEAMGRILLEVESEKEDDFVDFMTGKNIPFFTLGHITKGELRIDDNSLGYIDKMTPGV